MPRKTTTYWKAKCLDDHDAYSIRCRTKREVLELLTEHGCRRAKHPDHGRCFVDAADGSARFDIPEKIEVHYYDQMDLIQQLTGEGGGSF